MKVMISMGLGFVNRVLYLVSYFFKDKPAERLSGAGLSSLV